MAKHHTRRTISAAAWCNKCRRQTQHRVDDRRIGPCMECGKERPAEQKPLMVQEVDVPCTCAAYPFAHFHSRLDTNISRARFDRGTAPAQPEDAL